MPADLLALVGRPRVLVCAAAALAGALLLASCSASKSLEPDPVSGGCAFRVPADQLVRRVGSSSVSFSVTLTTSAKCAWSAASQASFISISAGSTGTGPGTISVTISSNTGAERSGTFTAGGVTVTVTQDAALPADCAFSVGFTSLSVGSAGGTSVLTVTPTKSASCAWTAVSSDPFVTVVNGASGTGAGSVTVSVEQNGGPARSAVLIVAGQTVAVTQAAAPLPCTFGINVTNLTISNAAQNSTFATSVTQGSNCTWAAISQASWIQVTSPSPQTGNGLTSVTVSANAGGPRTGTLLIAGQTVTITQTTIAPCSFNVTQSNVDALLPAAQTVTLSLQISGQNCLWSVVSNAAFLTVTSNASGVLSGTGTVPVTVAVAPNTGPARTGTLSVAGRTVFVRQVSPMLAVLSYRSDPGDPIGLGQAKTFTLQASQITAATNANLPPPQLWYTTMRVAMQTPEGTWNLRLDAPLHQSLFEGLVTDAGAPDTETMLPGRLLFSGVGRTCNQVTGRFIIGDSAFEPADRVARFHVVFEQHCDGATARLIGDLWISGDGTATPPPLSLPTAPVVGLRFLRPF